MVSTASPLVTALDIFPAGLVITNRNTHIVVAANQYFYDLCGQLATSVIDITSLLSNASCIMLESYVIPLLLNQQECDEVQLTLCQKNGQRLPVLVNVRISPDHPDLIHWVITAAQQRDSLYQELVNLRNNLEQKAEALATLANTDELTGLLNRRAFIEKANRIIIKSQKRGSAYAFFMIDIDNFKAINDEYGHDVGDKVLREIAREFQQNCRGNDALARVGGEEFALFSAVDNSEQAEACGERLLAAVRKCNPAGIYVTISIGLAVSSSANLSVLFKQADKLLYEVKQSGKNRVQCTTL